jgi:uncharacterized SAM-binding protein YcdF (DUF218 family)
MGSSMKVDVSPGDALIVLSAGLTPEEQLDTKSTQRMNVGIDAWRQDAAPIIVVTGDHSFMVKPASITYAEAMKRHAITNGVSEASILYEDRSLDTVAQALFTKTDMAMPREWERLLVVTSFSHMSRSEKIFRHVYGKDYDIEGIPAAEHVTTRERIYESLGSVMLQEIIRDTKSGDHEAIKERLFDLVPGYQVGNDATVRRLAVCSLTGLFKNR